MNTTRIKDGIYLIEYKSKKFIIKGNYATNNRKWNAFDCTDEYECCDMNNFGVQFNTKKELLDYIKAF